MPSSVSRFQSAQTDSEWFNILESLLHGLPQIYIIVDVEILNSSFCKVPEWIKEFHKLFEISKEESIQTTAKVALVSYRTNLLKDCSFNENSIVHLQKLREKKPCQLKIGLGKAIGNNNSVNLLETQEPHSFIS